MRYPDRDTECEQKAITICDNCISARVQGEMVLLNTETGRYFGLNEVGARIWELAKEPINISKVIDRLLSEYRVEREALLVDVEEVTVALVNAGLVKFIDPLPA